MRIWSLLSLTIVLAEQLKHSITKQTPSPSEHYITDDNKQIEELKIQVAKQSAIISELSAKLSAIPLSGETIYQKVAPATCRIETHCIDKKGFGSCSLVSNYFAITADHVLHPELCTNQTRSVIVNEDQEFDKDEPRITQLNNKPHIIYSNPELDISIIRLNRKVTKTLELEFNVLPGESGYEFGCGRKMLFMSPAHISQINDEKIILLGNSVPGDSGGALVNSKGKLIGVIGGSKYLFHDNQKQEKINDYAYPIFAIEDELNNLIKADDELMDFMRHSTPMPLVPVFKHYLQSDDKSSIIPFTENACQNLLHIFKKTINGCGGLIQDDLGQKSVLTHYRGVSLRSTEDLNKHFSRDAEAIISCPVIRRTPL